MFLTCYSKAVIKYSREMVENYYIYSATIVKINRFAQTFLSNFSSALEIAHLWKSFTNQIIKKIEQKLKF